MRSGLGKIGCGCGGTEGGAACRLAQLIKRLTLANNRPPQVAGLWE